MTRRLWALACLSGAAWPSVVIAQVREPGQAPGQTQDAPPLPPEQVSTAAPPPAEEAGQTVDIVVTALKQGETALRSPVTITILEPEALASRNIVAANQLNAVVPGLTMSVGVGGLPGTSFRGLGSNAAVFGLESSVTEYIDGAYMPHMRDYVAPLYDVDHIEFIKGTQSTLLGKNTSLGAISIVNRRPSRRFGYELRVTHSFEIDGNRVEAAVNTPIDDRLQIRTSFLASRDNGWVSNVYRGRSEPIQSDVSGRIGIAWQPAPTIDVFASYQHDDRHLRGQGIEVLNDPAGVIAARARGTGFPFDPDAINVSANASGPVGGTAAGPAPLDRQSTNRLNVIVDIAIGTHTLTSQTAYTTWRSPRVTDLDFTAAHLFNIIDDERSRTFSQEIRLASPTRDRLQYIAGLFYFHNRWDYQRTFGGAPSNALGFPLVGNAASRTILPTRTYSAFASGSFEIVTGLKVDAGVRYTHETKEGTFVRAATGSIGQAFPAVPFTTYTPQVTQPLDFNVGLRFEPTASLLLYGSYSKGSKSGGFQDAPTTLAAAPFAPETAYSAEAGAKLRVRGGYLTAALFDTRVNGFQTSFTTAIGTPAIVQIVVGNTDVRSRGVEANASYEPVPGLTVAGNVVYADAIFRDAFPANASIARAGDPLTRAPRWSGNATIDYARDVGNLALFGGVRTDFASRTLYQFLTQQPLAPFGSARATIDARLGVRGEESRWELALIGTNLADRRIVDFSTPITAGGGAYYGSYNRPRIIALQFSLRQ